MIESWVRVLEVVSWVRVAPPDCLTDSISNDERPRNNNNNNNDDPLRTEVEP